MKKLLLAVFLSLFTFNTSKAQYYMPSIMGDGEVWYFYDSGLGSGYKVLEKMRDTVYWTNIFDSIYFTKYDSSKNDGTPNSILWTRADGKIMKSPTDSIKLTMGQIIDFPVTLSTIEVLNFPNTSAGQYSDLTVNVTGANLNDMVLVNTRADLEITTGAIFKAWVSSPGVVTVRYLNLDSSSNNLDSANFYVKVLK
jgi:hypothetical protein